VPNLNAINMRLAVHELIWTELIYCRPFGPQHARNAAAAKNYAALGVLAGIYNAKAAEAADDRPHASIRVEMATAASRIRSSVA
jgi:hypothetical protein